MPQPTITVEDFIGAGHPVEINARDFDPEVHTRYDPDAEPREGAGDVSDPDVGEGPGETPEGEESAREDVEDPSEGDDEGAERDLGGYDGPVGEV